MRIQNLIRGFFSIVLMSLAGMAAGQSASMVIQGASFLTEGECTIIVGGDLQSDVDGSITVSSETQFHLGRNWNTYGFLDFPGSIRFYGGLSSFYQNDPGALFQGFGTVIIDKPIHTSPINLSSDMLVFGNLDLQQGLVGTGNFWVRLMPNCTFSTANYQTAYVSSAYANWGWSGGLEKSFAPGEWDNDIELPLLLPIGTNLSASPFIVNSAASDMPELLQINVKYDLSDLAANEGAANYYDRTWFLNVDDYTVPAGESIDLALLGHTVSVTGSPYDIDHVHSTATLASNTVLLLDPIPDDEVEELWVNGICTVEDFGLETEFSMLGTCSFPLDIEFAFADLSNDDLAYPVFGACNASDITLTAVQGSEVSVAYEWYEIIDGGEPVQISTGDEIIISVEGVYEVTCIDGDGCIAYANIEVFGNQTPNIPSPTLYWSFDATAENPDVNLGHESTFCPDSEYESATTPAPGCDIDSHEFFGQDHMMGRQIHAVTTLPYPIGADEELVIQANETDAVVDPDFIDQPWLPNAGNGVDNFVQIDSDLTGNPTALILAHNPSEGSLDTDSPCTGDGNTPAAAIAAMDCSERATEFTYEFMVRPHPTDNSVYEFIGSGAPIGGFRIKDYVIGFGISFSDCGLDDEPNYHESFAVPLSGVGPLSYNYYLDGNWHHFAITVDLDAAPFTGRAKLYVDGVSCPEFTHDFGVSSNAVIPNHAWNKQWIGHSYTGWGSHFDIDEIAIWGTEALSPAQIWQHYLESRTGHHYGTDLCVDYCEIPQAPEVTTHNNTDYTENYLVDGALLSSDPNDDTGLASPTDQLLRAPSPRFASDHSLHTNIPWWHYYHFGDFGADADDDANITALQQELIDNWNYSLTVYPKGEGDDHNEPLIAQANITENADVPLSMQTHWRQINPSAHFPEETWDGPWQLFEGFSADHYIEGAAVNRRWSFEAPMSPIEADGHIQNLEIAQTLALLSRPIDHISENGEIYPGYNFPYAPTNTSVLSYQDVKDAIGGGWFAVHPETGLEVGNAQEWKDFQANHKTLLRSTYRDEMMEGLGALENAEFSYYSVDGNGGHNGFNAYPWEYIRSINQSENAMGDVVHYSTPDIYPRNVFYWYHSSGDPHGISWFRDARQKELVVTEDTRSAPFVCAGFSHDPRGNIRPGQWLGMLKVMSAAGAEYFNTGYFIPLGYNQNNWQNPEHWAWQSAMPGYAQGTMSLVDDIILEGDYVEGDDSKWVFVADGRFDVVTAVRTHASTNRYLISSSLGRNTNLFGEDAYGNLLTPTAESVDITLDGSLFGLSGDLQLQARPQGSTYVLEVVAGSVASLIQLDGWHENKHPDFWSEDFVFEAEVGQSTDINISVPDQGLNTGLDYRTFTTSVASGTVQYPFQVRVNQSIDITENGDFDIWLRLKSASADQSLTLRILEGDATSVIQTFDLSLCQSVSDFTWIHPDLLSIMNLPDGNYFLELELDETSDIEVDQLVMDFVHDLDDGLHSSWTPNEPIGIDCGTDGLLAENQWNLTQTNPCGSNAYKFEIVDLIGNGPEESVIWSLNGAPILGSGFELEIERKSLSIPNGELNIAAQVGDDRLLLNFLHVAELSNVQLERSGGGHLTSSGCSYGELESTAFGLVQITENTDLSFASEFHLTSGAMLAKAVETNERGLEIAATFDPTGLAPRTYKVGGFGKLTDGCPFSMEAAEIVVESSGTLRFDFDENGCYHIDDATGAQSIQFPQGGQVNLTFEVRSPGGTIRNVRFFPEVDEHESGHFTVPQGTTMLLEAWAELEDGSSSYGTILVHPMSDTSNPCELDLHETGSSQNDPETEMEVLDVRLHVYPNPNTGEFTVEMDGMESGDALLRVVNSLGQKVHEARAAGVRTVLDIGHLSPGVYYLVVERKGEQLVKRVVLQ